MHAKSATYSFHRVRPRIDDDARDSSLDLVHRDVRAVLSLSLLCDCSAQKFSIVWQKTTSCAGRNIDGSKPADDDDDAMTGNREQVLVSFTCQEGLGWAGRDERDQTKKNDGKRNANFYRIYYSQTERSRLLLLPSGTWRRPQLETTRSGWGTVHNSIRRQDFTEATSLRFNIADAVVSILISAKRSECRSRHVQEPPKPSSGMPKPSRSRISTIHSVSFRASNFDSYPAM